VRGRVAVNAIAAGNRELVMLVDVLAREKNVPREGRMPSTSK